MSQGKIVPLNADCQAPKTAKAALSLQLQLGGCLQQHSILHPPFLFGFIVLLNCTPQFPFCHQHFYVFPNKPLRLASATTAVLVLTPSLARIFSTCL